MNEKGFAIYAKEIEESVLSDTFWNVTLPQNLESSSINSPAFSTFIAAQMWIAMENFGVPRECVYADKQSGKDIDRPAYN